MSTEQQAKNTVAYWTGVLEGEDGAAHVDPGQEAQVWFKLGCVAHPAAKAINVVLGTIFIAWLTSWLKSVFQIKD